MFIKLYGKGIHFLHKSNKTSTFVCANLLQMIDQTTIGKIMDATQIVDVVSDFVTLKKRGVNYLGLCPFHNEKTASFTVSPAKGIFKCFGCGKGGNAVHFIMEHEQMSYVDALKYLAKKYHIEVVERELSDEEKIQQSDRESMLAVNAFAAKYFADMLHNHRDGKAIGMNYFRERGFSDETILKFQLGYSLDESDAFYREAVAKGFKTEFLEKTGLSPKREDGSYYDRFRGRVMFPIHTISGKVVAFGGRTLKKDDKTAKYLNSPESEIYHKSDELYGIFFAKQAIVKEDRCFLVEGYTDVISMHQAGVQNVVASSGTSLTSGQIRLIHRFTPNITVLYDGDAAGIKASIRGIDLLLEEGMNVKVLLLPDGEDPDSYARKHNASDFIDFIDKNQVDFIRFKINLLLQDVGNDPIKKATLIGDVVRSIALIPNKLIASEYVKECSTLLAVDEKIIYNEINKLKRKKREEEQKRASTTTTEVSDIPSAVLAEGEVQISIDQATNQQELDILYFVIRHGVEFLYSEYEPESQQLVRHWSVGEYIVEQLFGDNIEFKSPINKSFLNEFALHLRDEEFNPTTFFLQHPHPQISRLAVDLMTDKYQLSKIFTREEHNFIDEKYQSKAKAKREAQKQEEHRRWLLESVPRVIYEYKNSIVVDLIKAEMQKLKEATEAADLKAAESIMKTIANYNTLKAQFAKELGERVIVKMS